MRSLFILILYCSLAYAYPTIPDFEMTPGHLCTVSNPHFKEYRYEEKIPYCRRSVSSGFKRHIYESYGVPENERRNYTIDHLIPLSIGGSNSSENLWPEHKEIKALRPNLEFYTYLSIQQGQITQEEAISIILEAKLNPYSKAMQCWDR